MEEVETQDCRNCKATIKVGIGRCPYCGILNPTLKIKEVFVTIAVVLFVMSIVTYLR